VTAVAITARAPGKVFVAGEWAVLRGAPALVAAVDRWAEVTVTPGGPGGVTVLSHVDGETRVPAPDAGELPTGDAGAVLAAWRVAAERERRLRDVGMYVEVDARAFVEHGRKLGLGRSAAVLAAAIAAFLGRTDAARDAALAAHARFQQGRGSGADVAAAWYGGLVEVTRTGGGLRVVPRTLPPGLELLVGWTGEGAATAPLLARFDAAGDPPVLGELRDTAAAAATAVGRGDAGGLAAAVARSADLLDRLGRETGLPLVTPALARLVAAAAGVGAVAKPSGAGGGDCGIALATSPAQAAAVRAAWQATGIVPLPVAVAARGVQARREPAPLEVSLA
jgi:phosphomevalonate kinase